LWLSRVGGASLSVDYLVLTRDDPEGAAPYARARTVVVLIDAETEAPVRLEQGTRTALEAFRGEPLRFRDCGRALSSAGRAPRVRRPGPRRRRPCSPATARPGRGSPTGSARAAAPGPGSPGRCACGAARRPAPTGRPGRRRAASAAAGGRARRRTSPARPSTARGRCTGGASPR